MPRTDRSAENQRRRWDSNPRYRDAVHRFSRPALSTTQAPLPVNSTLHPSGTSAAEESGQDRTALLGERAAVDDRSMVEAGIGGDPVQAVARPGLGIGRAIDDAGNPRLDQGAGTHRARLERDVERTAFQPPGA